MVSHKSLKVFSLFLFCSCSSDWMLKTLQRKSSFHVRDQMTLASDFSTEILEDNAIIPQIISVRNNHRSDAVAFFVLHISRKTMSTCSRIGHINLDDLIKLVSARFLHCKTHHSPLVFYQYFVGKYSDIITAFCPSSSNFYPPALGSIDNSPLMSATFMMLAN